MGKDRLIKICHVANTDMAVNFLLLTQLKCLRQRGFDVYAVCADGPLLEQVRKAGIKVKTVNFRRRVDPVSHFVTLIKLFFYFKKEKFDIVHTHTPVPSLLGQVAAKIAGVPVILNTVHGFYFQDTDASFKKKFFILIEKIAALCSDTIFSQNKKDIDTAVREGICAASKLRYLGNGIDLGRFDPNRFTDRFKTKKRQDLGIPEGHKIIGIVGRLVEEKGYLDLFEAFRLILQKKPSLALISVGPLENKKKDGINPKIVERYGIENNIFLLGQRTDMEEIYSLMDVFTLPSYREGFPRSIIEASAMGLPVVATAVRGCVEAVEDKKTGLLVPVRDPAKLADAIIYILDNPGVARVFGANGRQKALNSFGEEKVFSILLGEYHRLAELKIRK